MKRWKKLWGCLTSLGIALGLISDFLNLGQYFALSRRNPPVEKIIFEDYPPNPLPDCVFSERSQEEAEPTFYLNWFDWAMGIGPAEESAYAKAEAKIRHYLPIRDGEELRLVRREFYFDHSGYHAKMAMGRMRTDLRGEMHSSCTVNPERGDYKYETHSAAFTCDNLDQVMDQEKVRIQSSDREDRCWVSFSFETNPHTRRIRFEEEYFVHDREDLEEPTDETFLEN